MKRLLHGAWLAPMVGPPIRDGAVVIEAGRIVQVGPAAALRRAHPDAERIDCGDSLLLPGLVNPHTHLELSDAAAGEPPGGFVPWLFGIMARNQVPPEELPGRVAAAVARGAAECLRFGVTCAGDISKFAPLTRPALRALPLRAVSFGEVQAMAGRRTLLDQRLAAAADDAHATDRLSLGLSPHAPYSVEPDGYRRCLDLARQRRWPLATHLAESPDEAAFLAEHAGPFRELWSRLPWDDHVPRFPGGPIRFAQSLGLLDYPTLLAHVNYCDDDELAILAAGQASVVYCPRTHRYFGHPPHRFRAMLAAGINVALGTDSRASSPDLNVLDDLRFVHHLAPDLPVPDLWQLVTTRAARALNRDDVGRLVAGAWADLTVFPAAGEDPLREILETGALPRQVWINGEPIEPPISEGSVPSPLGEG